MSSLQKFGATSSLLETLKDTMRLTKRYRATADNWIFLLQLGVICHIDSIKTFFKARDLYLECKYLVKCNNWQEDLTQRDKE